MKRIRALHSTQHRPLRDRHARVDLVLIGVISALFLTCAPVGAQALKNPLVPAGRARLDFSSSFTAWDSRFGINAAGQDAEEALGDDLTDETGASLFPGLVNLEANLRAMASGLNLSPVIGSSLGQVQKDVSRIDLSLELGVFDWLTVGATVPWVQNRTTLDLAFTPFPGSELGLNPSLSGDGAVGATLSLLSDAASNARAWADATCQAGGPACQTAEALANRVEQFLLGSQGAYYGSPLFPTFDSSTADALRGALTDLDTSLSAAGLGPTGAVLPFSQEVLTAEKFLDLPSMPGAGIDGAPLQNVEGLWVMGDVEVHATVRLLEGEVRDSGAAAPSLSYMVAGTGLVRLGTGIVDDVDIFLDMGTGDGQMDIEASLFGALRVGNRLGVRARVRYGIQQAQSLFLRVAPHEVVMPPVNLKRAVRWTPGSYVAFSVSPRWHLTDELSLNGDYRFFTKGDDSYEIIGDAVLGGITADPADLAHESSLTVQEAGLGFTYSTMNTWRAGRAGSPLEFNGRVVRAVAGSGGRTPKSVRFELSFRIFRRIWGS